MLNITEYTSQIQPICESVKDNDDNVNPGLITPVYGCKKLGGDQKVRKTSVIPVIHSEISNLATRHGKHTKSDMEHGHRNNGFTDLPMKNYDSPQFLFVCFTRGYRHQGAVLSATCSECQSRQHLGRAPCSLAVTGFAGFFGQIHEFVPLVASVTSFDSFMIVDMVLLKTVYYVYY